jgi:hypothetical protein
MRWRGTGAIRIAVATGAVALALVPLRASGQEAAPAEPPAERTELVSERTQHAKFFAEPDGTHTAEYFTGPVHYLEDGAWEEIDTTVVPAPQPGAEFTNAAGPVEVVFSDPGSGETVSLTDGTESVGFSLAGEAPAAEAEAEGSGVGYQGIAPATDLTFEVLAQGLKETIVVEAPPQEPPVFRFPLTLEGLTARQEGTGEISLLDHQGQVRFTVPPGWMEDSSADPHTGLPASTDAVETVLAEEDGRQVITVRPDHSWLTDPARVYPVLVDPSFRFKATSDTYIKSDVPTTNFGGADRLRVGNLGTAQSPEKTRPLLKFYGVKSELENKTVLGATLDLSVEAWEPGCGANRIEVRRILEPWKASTATWQNRPKIGFVFDQDNIPCQTGYHSFTVTNAVLDWQAGGDNQGLALVGGVDGDELDRDWRRLYAAGTAKAPRLAVTYTMPQPEPPYRAFSPDSYWNTPLGEAPTEIQAEEDRILAWLAADSEQGEPWLHFSGLGPAGDYGMPVYWAEDGDPTYAVVGSCGGSLPPEFGAVRIPAGAKPDPSGGDEDPDNAMTVYDLENNLAYGFYEASYNQNTDTWSACRGSTWYLSSNGLHRNLAETDCTTEEFPPSGCVGHRGFPHPIHTVRLDEILYGEIDHVLKIAIDNTCGGPADGLPQHVWPAVGNEGCNTDDNWEHTELGDAPAEGTVIRLRPGVDLSELESPAARIIARALRDYGAIIGDQSGGEARLKVENCVAEGKGQCWDMILEDDDLQALPFTSENWEVIQYGHRRGIS